MHRRAAIVVASIALSQFFASLARRRIRAKAAGGAGGRPGGVVLSQASYILNVACLAGAMTVAAAISLAFVNTVSDLLATVGILLISGGLRCS